MYSVAVYLGRSAYGGPEEGGWWYDCGEPATFDCEQANLTRFFRTREEAAVYARELRESIKLQEMNEGRRPKSSVISDGVYEVHIQDGWPRSFPDVRPHYE